MTTVIVTVEDRVREFVEAVSHCFDDLREEDREELLADLEQHLLELAADEPDAFEAELGDPHRYASELRETAGLAAPGLKQPGRLSRWNTAVNDRVRSIIDHPRMDPVVEFVPMLRPTWWIVRAWAPLVLLGMIFGGQGWAANVVSPGGSLLGFLLLVGAVTFSVRAGMRGLDRGKWWRIATWAGGAAAVIVAMSVLFSSSSSPNYVEVYPSTGGFIDSQLLTHPDGEGITNLYVFDANGTLLRDVFVYDGAGRPVEVGPAVDQFFGIRSEVAVAADGQVLGNLYPITQYVEDDEGGLRLREIPLVDIPALTTDPMELEPVSGIGGAPQTTSTPATSATTTPAPSPSEPTSVVPIPDRHSSLERSMR